MARPAPGTEDASRAGGRGRGALQKAPARGREEGGPGRRRTRRAAAAEHRPAAQEPSVPRLRRGRRPCRRPLHRRRNRRAGRPRSRGLHRRRRRQAPPGTPSPAAHPRGPADAYRRGHARCAWRGSEVSPWPPLVATQVTAGVHLALGPRSGAQHSVEASGPRGLLATTNLARGVNLAAGPRSTAKQQILARTGRSARTNCLPIHPCGCRPGPQGRSPHQGRSCGADGCRSGAGPGQEPCAILPGKPSG